ncbi:MAG TPA: DinB family protein [Gemmatirosa sp.]
MRTPVLSLAALVLGAAPGVAAAQNAASTRGAAPARSAAARSADPGMTATRAVYSGVKDNLLKTASQASDSDYAFRPIAGVRTLGEVLAHVAAGQFYYCSKALGETSPMRDDVEKTRTTKAAISDALQQSFTYCDRAYALTDAQALAMTGGQGAGVPSLIQNAAHDNEHYGNLVTYLRLRGRVPPSSQRAGM